MKKKKINASFIGVGTIYLIAEDLCILQIRTNR